MEQKTESKFHLSFFPLVNHIQPEGVAAEVFVEETLRKHGAKNTKKMFNCTYVFICDGSAEEKKNLIDAIVNKFANRIDYVLSEVAYNTGDYPTIVSPLRAN